MINNELQYKHKSPESPNTYMPEVNYYLQRMSNILVDNYKINGRPAECARIAIDIAKIIISKGGNPQIINIKSKIINPETRQPKNIVPRRYVNSGQVRWIDHTVCENNGLIYDPLIGFPISKENYLISTFTEPVIFTIDFTSEQTKTFIKQTQNK